MVISAAGIFGIFFIIFSPIYAQDYYTIEDGNVTHHVVTLHDEFAMEEIKVTGEEIITLLGLRHQQENLANTALVVSIIGICISVGITSLFFIIQWKQSKKIISITNKRLKSFYFNVNWGFAEIHDVFLRQQIDYSKSLDELKKQHNIIGVCIENIEKLLDENKDIEDIEVRHKLERIKGYWNIEKEHMEIRKMDGRQVFEIIERLSKETIAYIQKNYF